MPYIKPERRAQMELSHLYRPINCGELNYAITKLLISYIDLGAGRNYPAINDCLGALEGAKLEFYRRVVVPYEEARKLDNGDVYPSWGV